MFLQYVPSCSSVRYVKYFIDSVRLHRLDPYEIAATYLKNNRVQVLELCYTLLNSGGAYDRDLARLLKIYKVNRIRLLAFTTWIGVEDVEKSRRDSAFILPTPLTELAAEHVKMNLVESYVEKLRFFITQLVDNIKMLRSDLILKLLSDICSRYVNYWSRDELDRIASTIVRTVRTYIRSGMVLITL